MAMSNEVFTGSSRQNGSLHIRHTLEVTTFVQDGSAFGSAAGPAPDAFPHYCLFLR